jgi:hypothetical protein
MARQFGGSKKPTKREIQAAIQAAIMTAQRGGGGYDSDSSSSSESDDDMTGGGFGSALISIGSRLAKSGVKVGERVAVGAEKGATTVVREAAPSLASRIGARTMTALNTAGIVAAVGLPAYSVYDIVKTNKADAARAVSDAATQRQNDLDTAQAKLDAQKNKDDNDKFIADSLAGTAAEKKRWETETQLVQDAYAQNKADTDKQNKAFEDMMDMILNGRNGDTLTSGAPPNVAAGPTQAEIDAAIAAAMALPPAAARPPATSTPPPAARPPATSTPPAARPPVSRRKGGAIRPMPPYHAPPILRPSASEIKKAIASARRHRRGGAVGFSDFF